MVFDAVERTAACLIIIAQVPMRKMIFVSFYSKHLIKQMNCGGIALYWLKAAQLEAGSSYPVWSRTPPTVNNDTSALHCLSQTYHW